MLQLPSDQLITTPFCASGTPITDFVLPPIAGSDGSLIQTQQFGIPPAQAKDPDFGGVSVLRTETNGVLQFYSNVLYFMNQGGQFTFDVDQSTALGGYSEGAVLFDFATKSYVISLIDNNTFDFVTTPSYIDGTHWIKLNSLAYPDITDGAGLVSVIGANGLKVYKSASFADDTLGPKITFERTTSHLPNTYNWVFSSEASISIIPGQTHGVVIQLLGGNTGAALVGSYNDNPRLFSSGNIRELDPTIYVNALPLLGELPVTRIFTVNDDAGNTWKLACTSTGCNFPVPTNVGLNIIGSCISYSVPTGSVTRLINLSGINTTILMSTEAVISKSDYATTNPNALWAFTSVGNNISVFTGSPFSTFQRLSLAITII